MARSKLNIYLDNSADNKLAAFLAAGGKKYVEIVFAIFSALKIVEDSIGEGSETLCTHKTLQFWRIFRICI